MLVVALSAVTAGAASASGLRPIALGFGDNLFSSPSLSVRNLWLGRAVSLASQVVRLDVGWPASTKPTHPANPADPAYNFTSDDATVISATRHGLTPLVMFTAAPTWAEGPNRPASAAPGSWLPQPAALRAYGQALATRYNGRYPNPADPGSVLPRVTHFQVWNEPNLSIYLSPQWQHVKGKWVPTASNQYRAMLNAFYAGVKAADPAANVVTAGTAPYGDFGHRQRTMPLLFWENVLKAPTSFDVLAHQPYGVFAPATHALNADDISIADIGKLASLLRRTERQGTALPHIHHPIWITETGYDTNPPNPGGVTLATDARYVEQSIYLFWKQDVSAVTWFLIRDLPPNPTYADSSETGMYFLSGKAKPAATAFRFPVVGVRSGKRLLAWLRAPSAGTVTVTVTEHGAKRIVYRHQVTRFEVLQVPLPATSTSVSASLGTARSLSWRF
jgi:hypothetical protein